MVKRTTCLLGVDQVHGKFTRIGYGFLDGVFCDLGELNPVKRDFLGQFFIFKDLIDVPGNSLALAVEIGCEIDRLRLSRRFNNRIDMLFAAFAKFITHTEIIVGIDGTVLGRQITYMAIGGKYLEIVS